MNFFCRAEHQLAQSSISVIFSFLIFQNISISYSLLSKQFRIIQ